jgi:hypothetical protein
VPALLQQGTEHLAVHLCCIFRACQARGYIPKAWRQVKVTFIPKPNYAKAKAHCPITLSSFMLKTTEKLVNRHMKDEILTHHMNQTQSALQPGKSTETALHNVVTHTEVAANTGKWHVEPFYILRGPLTIPPFKLQ